ncbi:MAG: hypothetical protein LC713_01810, partial [Actinobacteria bacterium]|nr:hypothetical protein [Actinomycetota bacterium]
TGPSRPRRSATGRPTCRPGSIRCSCGRWPRPQPTATPRPGSSGSDVASVLTVSYHLFRTRATADAWYEQSLVAGGVAADTGRCRAAAFHGQVDYESAGAAVGQYFCLFNDKHQPLTVARDRRVAVDYQSEVFHGTGRPAAENLLRLWTCCIQIQP